MEAYNYVLILLLLIALWWDIRFKRIPNWLTVSGTAAGFLYHFIFDGLDGVVFSSIGMVAAGGTFLFLYIFRAIGAGDVKLFAAIGAIAGVQFVFYLMMYSILYAGIIALVILLFTRTFLKKMALAVIHLLSTWNSRDISVLETYQKQESTRFAFMYAVIPAVATTYYYFYF
ncbi:MAG TPA: A24 family peptidase [Bacillales bacterium]|nr:A24 family peptidase [Bacillales bacterium]